MSDKGRWFRVYARQLREHPKFRDMSGLELGAWLALRAEAELRDKALFADVDEAILILRRRRLPGPKAMVYRLIERRLFDLAADGTLMVHDRADHDRPQYPSDAPDQTAERKRKSRAGHESVTSRDSEGTEYSHDTHAGVQPQQATPANSLQPQPQPAGAGLPGEDDSATAACRMFLNGGEWLSNREYVAAWDDLDRRYTREWVRTEIQPAYADILSKHPKVKPWDLKRMVEFRCAQKARIEERDRLDRQAEADRQESEALRARAEAATAEERERASIIRRAVGLWMKRHPDEPVPGDFDELKSWLERNEQGEAA